MPISVPAALFQHVNSLRMPRIHLFELEDQSWFPKPIRNGITDFLQFAVSVSDLYRPFASRLARAIDTGRVERIVDLCAGAGGPWLELKDHVESIRNGSVSVCLTDLYPNHTAFERLKSAWRGTFGYVAEPVSATDVPSNLVGLRTLFSSFHHFRPDEAVKILGDAVSKRQGIAIAESTQRHPLLIAYMFLTPALVLLSSVFQKPFRWSRLFWTYVVPLVPLAVLFDGVVSCLRTYTPDELMALVARVPDGGSYHWEAGVDRIGFLPVGVTYLVGYPRVGNI
ncbi:MAG TPA: class I SAM-dependent methyltransferase [Burkholderiaceae bacterium]|nr:class I SAM-dependent methyltransferase [Burkholderiaceae bacterium]